MTRKIWTDTYENVVQDNKKDTSSITPIEKLEVRNWSTWKDFMRELLAHWVHRSWSGWMKYLFSKGTFNEDGTWTMPKWAVERWQRQMNTEYDLLPENEKDTDRNEANQIIEILDNTYSARG